LCKLDKAARLFLRNNNRWSKCKKRSLSLFSLFLLPCAQRHIIIYSLLLLLLLCRRYCAPPQVCVLWHGRRRRIMHGYLILWYKTFKKCFVRLNAPGMRCKNAFIVVQQRVSFNKKLRYKYLSGRLGASAGNILIPFSSSSYQIDIFGLP
jgi:hypothetical protein